MLAALALGLGVGGWGLGLCRRLAALAPGMARCARAGMRLAGFAALASRGML